MGHFGFGYVGLAFLLLLFVPNLFWLKNKPEGYDPSGESRVLSILERVGEIGVTCTAVVFTDCNLRPWSPWSLWLVAAAGAMALYEVWWLRYFRSPHRMEDFYRSLLGVPVAGATLPVAALLLLGIYGRFVWLLLFAAILGVGHIGIHLRHRAALPSAPA